MFFIYFVIIFLLAYSITSYALIVTKHQVLWVDSKNKSSSRQYKVLNNGSNLWHWDMLRDVLDWGTWKVYAQIDNEAFYNYEDGVKITGKSEL